MAVEVGAEGPRALREQLPEGVARRVAVGVARPYRGQREPRPRRREERRVLVVAAVVRDLQHVDRLDARLDEVGLRLRLDVSREQRGQAGRAQAQHQRAVVGVRPGAAVAAARRQDRPGHRTDAALLTQGGLHDRHALVAGPPDDLLVLGLRLGQRPDLDERHRPAQDTGQPEHVVGVLVGQQHQRDPVDVEPVEAAVRGDRVGSDVDDEPAADDDHVALPDVAHREHPVARRPRRRDGCEPGARDQRSHDAGREDPPQQPLPDREPAEQRRARQQAGALEPVGPAETGAGDGRTHTADAHQPRDRQVAHPGEQLRERQAERRHDRGEHAEDGRRCHGRDGQQVGRDRQQAELTGDRDDDGSAGDLCRGRDRHRLGEPARPPRPPTRQRVPPPGGQQQQPGGGEHRQGEPRRGCQVRVQQHQAEGGGSEGGHCRPPATRPERDQRHATHHGSAQHRRRRSRQHHEGRQGDRGEHRRAADPDAEPAGQQQDRAAQDRDVGAGDGSEVREACRAEVLAKLRVEVTGVTDDQARQQAALVVRQRRDGVAQPLPKPPGGALQCGRVRQHLGRTATGQHRSDVVAGLGRPQSTLHADPLRRQQREPLRRAREHHDRHPQPVLAPPAAQHLDAHPRDHQLPPRPGQHRLRASRVVGDDRLHDDRRLPLGRVLHRGEVATGEPA